jgi:hypothetical protein
VKFKLNGPIGEGREIEFDENQMLVREARLLQKVTGMGLRQFGEGMREGNIDALMGMVFLALRREGVAVQWSALDEFNIADLEVIEAPADDTEGADTDTDGGDPDPDGLGSIVVRRNGDAPGGDGDGGDGEVGPRPTPVDDPLKAVPVAIP